MKRSIVFFIVACCAWQDPAYARYRNETVTPTNTITRELTFQVSVEDREDLTFSVTVSSSTQTALSTNIHARLILCDSQGQLSRCPVESNTKTDSLNYSFTMRKNLVPTSYLIVSTGHFIHGYNADGKPSGSKIAVGTIYRVNLNDFVNKNPEPGTEGDGLKPAP